ncbi:hypothetical protein IV73_GL000284 [Weissella kandleri]|uniref:S1 motif domain-containing protein n=1 Tax=Weissella kandleri TaxID=1616 RepID=A0A0R2JEK2_9LACO|nr:S1-like domain-containing RNA-binding protein [Weissella kandleri]KRN75785.1 hypothetical protein IV73_GL000284 [Weissella kandleri]
MSKIIGEVVTAQVTDENEQAFFAQIDGQTYQIDKSELLKPLKIGGMVTGFAYENKDGQLQITKQELEVTKGHYAFGTVTDARRDLGVFVDVGLPNKDLVVSLDELPTIHELWPQRGDRLLITLRVDTKQRLWGELAPVEVFNAIRIPAKPTMKGQKNVLGTVYRLKMVGTLVLTDDFHVGFIHPSERYQEPRLGQRVEARVIGVRDDGILNLSLKPLAYKAISGDAKLILTLLQRTPTHQLPYNDHSDPAEIKQYFGMSKGQFKRALGHLYKERLITQNDQGIELVLSEESSD